MQPQNVTKLPTLARLVEQLKEAKRAEGDALKARVAAEEALLAHPDVLACAKDEGTVTHEGFKVAYKLTRSWDQAKLAEVARGIDPAWFPFKTSMVEDRKASKVVEERFPELWDAVRVALTLKPAKTAVTLTGEAE